MAEFRESLELDLRTSMENSWISSAGCSHYLGLVGDCDTGAVHIHSTFGVRRTEMEQNVSFLVHEVPKVPRKLPKNGTASVY